MSRSSIYLLLIALCLGLGACQSPEESEAKKEAKTVAVLTAPKTADDGAWKLYLQQVVSQNMAGVTDRVFPYYLPADSVTVNPSDNKSQYDRQLENVNAVIQRTVLPGNMLAFGSPDSARMADLILAAFTGAKADALKGSQVLFIGKPADSARVQPVVEAAGGKYIFVEAK